MCHESVKRDERKKKEREAQAEAERQKNDKASDLLKKLERTPSKREIRQEEKKEAKLATAKRIVDYGLLPDNYDE